MANSASSQSADATSTFVIIYVVVAVHNRWSFTEQFLSSLHAQDLPPGATMRIVVVDDGSSDETGLQLRLRTDVSVIRGNGTWWWCGSVDRALSRIRDQLNPEDFVYLGNNDTVLDPGHIAALLRSSQKSGCDLVGSVSFEIWPNGERHAVTGAFYIDERELNVVNIRPDEMSQRRVDALAGRGLLLNDRASRAIRFRPKVMPQHFADLAATSGLIRAGFRGCVSLDATSTQLERAGSSVEYKPSLAQLFNPKSPLYVPALVTFWATLAHRKFSLIWRMPTRAIRQITQGSYRVR